MAWSTPGPFEVAGKPLLCVVCKGTQFSTQEILLNTRGMTFFGYDAFNRGATAAVCAACGFVHEFARPQ
jgi:hypothetical protein